MSIYLIWYQLFKEVEQSAGEAVEDDYIQFIPNYALAFALQKGAQTSRTLAVISYDDIRHCVPESQNQ